MLFGREINGSKRWLALGPFSFQPSEFAKVALILFLADLVTKNVKTIGKMWTLCRIMFWILPIVGLVGASNLSTAIIILGIGVILIFVASPKYAQFAMMGIAGACFMGIFLALESYRLERLAIWRNPEKYEKGYQTLQGLYAIGSGGVFGVGIGNSVQKLGFVPEAQNDMIFSIICEELGLAGAGIIVFLFLLLIWRFFLIASGSRDLYGALIATGAMAHMMIQVILNIAVVTNTIPNTGIPRRFASRTAMFSLYTSTMNSAAGRRVRSAIEPRFFSSLARWRLIWRISRFERFEKVPSAVSLSMFAIFLTALRIVGKLVSIPPGQRSIT